MNRICEFGFDELDDLALATNIEISTYSNQFTAGRLGPLVELVSLKVAGINHLPSLSDFEPTQRLMLLQSLYSGIRVNRSESLSGTIQVIQTYWNKDEEPDQWFVLCEKMENAAFLAGFDKQNARGLVAAFRELVSNIFDHSEAVKSGLAGYAIRARDLEFVVADTGIGILQSLKTSKEFRYLRDAGEALRVALQDGVSRHGTQTGHGGGFRPLFQGLTNLASFLRVRSSDHALEIKGLSPTIAQAQIQQKVHLPGVIISISCAP